MSQAVHNMTLSDTMATLCLVLGATCTCSFIDVVMLP